MSEVAAGEPAHGSRAVQVAVVGAGGSEAATLAETAEAVGRGLAEAGATLVCGGLGGVMEAACRGAKSANGPTVGVLPGTDAHAANPYVDVVIPTGLGEARNALVARAGAATIAVGGGYGTLAEIALALRAGVAVIGLETWELAREGREVAAITRARSPQEAVGLALAEAARYGRSGGLTDPAPGVGRRHVTPTFDRDAPRAST